MILETIKQPADLRRLSYAELDDLAGEIRDFIVMTVSETAGHLGSNLGAVELTLALHRVFDSPRDAILWDTGHQAYVHKLVTGRQSRVQHAAPARWPVGLSEPCRVRARLRREQPCVDDPVVRVRLGCGPRHRGGRGRRRGRVTACGTTHRRGDRRRVDDRRHGLRGPQQPRPQRSRRDHRAERQRPLVRADRVEPVEEPHAGAPQPGVHASSEELRGVGAERAARRSARRTRAWRR